MNIDFSTDLPKPGEVGFTKRVIFFDLETSGLNRDIPDACVLEIGAALMETDGSISSSFSQVICPTEELIAKANPRALQVNGFTPEILREEGVPKDVAWKMFADWLKENKVVGTKTYIVGHNVGFDLDFLWEEAPAIARKYGWAVGQPRVMDNMEQYDVAQSKFIVPFIGMGRKGKSAKNIAIQLGVDPEDDVHRALGGVMVNHRIYMNLAQRTRKWLDNVGPTK